MKNKDLIKYTIIISIFAAIFIFFPYQNYAVISFFRIVFWSIFILFMPGYFLTLSFFGKKEIDYLERFALSFALSISFVPLISLYLNLIWIKINELTVFLITLFVIISNIIYIFYFKDKKLWKVN